MPRYTYDWQRFWYRANNTNQFNDGYLYTFESASLRRSYHPDVISFEEISEVPCLVLLGEAGMGKTHAISKEEEALRNRSIETLFINLGDCGSENTLIRNIFEEEIFLSWSKGTHQLHLFLDGLDECQSRIPTGPKLLINELKKHRDKLNRLFLRIACRTGAWPNELENGLKQLWGESGVEIYVLAQLSEKDVKIAALKNGLEEADKFINEIRLQEIVSLAARPVTLNLLLRIYQKDGQLPSKQEYLYHEGCQELCGEWTESRQQISPLEKEQRMAVAARIAAITLLTGQPVIWRGLNSDNLADKDAVVTVQELCGGKEHFNRNGFKDEVPVDRANVLETLSTGLFSYRETNLVGWAHRTYAEFLAAWYLKHHQFTLPQIRSLLFHPDGRLVPQLQGIATWLAGMMPEMFQEVMEADPDVLLQSNVTIDDFESRTALVKSLLKLCDEGKLRGRGLLIYRQGTKLAHPNLAGQLQPYICDTSKHEDVRCLAIDIAQVCKVQTLQGDLAAIALDTDQPLTVRVEAASAVCRIGDEETKAKLKPLAIGETGEDPEQELKAWGFRAVWPTHMTLKELLSVLAPPKQKYFGGEYQDFIKREITQHLQPADLPVALKWVEQQPTRRDLKYPLGNLSDAIMKKAWESLEFPNVLEGFATVALKRLKKFDEIIDNHLDESFENELRNNDDKRRKVIESILPLLEDLEKDSIVLFYHRGQLILNKDFLWMLERLQATKSDQNQRVWIHLIRKAFRLNETDQCIAVLTASQNNSDLAEAFGELLKPIDLDSSTASQLREQYLEIQQWEQPRQNPPLLDPPPKDRIVSLLNVSESDNSAAWLNLIMEMTLEPNSTQYGNPLEARDLTAFPGWKEAEPLTRNRLIETAKRYVLKGDPETDEWLGTNKYRLTAYGGYLALKLLLRENFDFISTVTSDVWEKWAPVIVDYRLSSSSQDIEAHEQLIQFSYRYAPTKVIETLMCLLEQQNREHGSIFIPSALESESCWDSSLENALLAKAQSGTLKPQCVGQLLEILLHRGVKEARTFAESLVPLPPPSDGEERLLAIFAARALMFHGGDAGWSAVWPAIQQDPEFGRTLADAVPYSTRMPVIIEQADHLANLCIWLTQQLSILEKLEPDKDSEGPGAYFVGPKESITEWRNSILHHLKERGAFEEIQQVNRELPELDLKWMIIEAQNVARRRTWMPPKPEKIFELVINQDARLVRSGDELLNVIEESLQRLEDKLQNNETLAVIDLWNEVKFNLIKKLTIFLLKPLEKQFKGVTSAAVKLLGETDTYVYTPKEENTLSDYVKRHFDEDIKERAIIINREVEINRGEYTDLRIDALIKNSNGEIFESVSAIIEVKGVWNKTLNHAMKTQLLEGYLNEEGCQHGLYLVGWYNCSKWNDKDYKKTDARRYTKNFIDNINEAKKHFACEATNLSQKGKKIKAFVINVALP